MRGRNRCLLAVSAEEATPPELDAAFAAAWRSLFASTYRSAVQPRSVERTSPAGSRHAYGEGEIEDASGNRMVVRLFVFPLGAKSQWIIFMGSGAQALEACREDWNAFFASLRFGSAAADAPATGAEPRPSTPAGAPARPADPPARPADGQPQRFENVTFVPPAGWIVSRPGGIVRVTATGTRGQERLEVLFLSARPASAGYENALSTTWSETASLLGAQEMRNVSGRPYDVKGPALTLRGIEYVTADGAMRNGAGEWNVEPHLFRAGDRIERVVVLGISFTENLSRVTTARNMRFARELRRMLFTMKFANVPEQQVQPAGLRPGGIVGVWAGIGMSFGRMKPLLAVFLDNGMAYMAPSFPLDGLYQIEPVAEQPSHQRDWGTYTWSGTSGVLTMPYGKIPLLSLGTRLQLTTNNTPHRYVRLSMPPNSRLDGTWCYSDGACIRFLPDGRFEDGGAIRIAEHSVYAWPESPAGGRGRYTLRDHTLLLSYDGGPEHRLAFPGIEDANTSSPDAIWLGWNVDRLGRR
jgi:hypothetical protein